MISRCIGSLPKESCLRSVIQIFPLFFYLVAARPVIFAVVPRESTRAVGIPRQNAIARWHQEVHVTLRPLTTGRGRRRLQTTPRFERRQSRKEETTQVQGFLFFFFFFKTDLFLRFAANLLLVSILQPLSSRRGPVSGVDSFASPAQPSRIPHQGITELGGRKDRSSTHFSLAFSPLFFTQPRQSAGPPGRQTTSPC